MKGNKILLLFGSFNYFKFSIHEVLNNLPDRLQQVPSDETSDHYRLTVRSVACDNMVIQFARMAYQKDRKIKSKKVDPD